MDKSIAASIIRKVRSLDNLLNDIDADLRQISAKDEQQQLSRSLARVIAELDSGLVRPIARRFPDLDPDR